MIKWIQTSRLSIKKSLSSTIPADPDFELQLRVKSVAIANKKGLSHSQLRRTKRLQQLLDPKFGYQFSGLGLGFRIIPRLLRNRVSGFGIQDENHRNFRPSAPVTRLSGILDPESGIRDPGSGEGIQGYLAHKQTPHPICLPL
jgi:hypothetical protein